MIPTSAAIQHDLPGYDGALEDFSTRIMPFVDYTIDESDGSMVVNSDTADLYRYPDLTVQVEALCKVSPRPSAPQRRLLVSSTPGA